MKKILLFLMSFFLTFQMISAQRDTEHWIAPYFAVPGSSIYQNRLYISTDSTTPFDVEIFSNNTLLTTVTVSKGNPQTYNVDRPIISGTSNNDAFRIINKGLYLKGQRPFYCSLRLAETSHGEIITSKGKAGIGTKFYVATSPTTFNPSYTSYRNFTAGILATEDNTNVTVSWTNRNVTFTGGTPTGTTHSFTLNKGQSFIFTGLGTVQANSGGFTGAKVTADKPVTLTNGSSNGNYTTSPGDGSDPILDQSVPVDKLGNTFAMVKTMSTDPDLNAEGGLIIATEDNTEIYLNGATAPAATLNEGQSYRINEDSYVAQAGTAPHSNMYISASKNIYLYQFIGIHNDGATNGFNYIPPLNCFLPRRIDEIGQINEMPGINPNTYPISLKLNILTEAGATVLVNDIPPTPAQGPFPLAGNAQWVTYAIENVTGNLTITSNRAVTAGINGGYSSAGYGGYFAGFSSIPVITKRSGECAPGIILEVNDGYDTYQWYRNGNVIAGATASTYSPTLSGNYSVRISVGSCPPVTTAIYKVFSCLKVTTQNLNICATKIITPVFTASSQTPVPSTVQILTAPTHGNAVVNPNGTITYTPNANYNGPDNIVYRFCGNDTEFTDCEQITLNLTVVPFVVKDDEIKTCQYDIDPYAYFDLTTADIIDYAAAIKKYYVTMADLNAGIREITTPENFPSAGGVIFVKVTTVEGCMAVAKITLTPLPIKKSPILADQYICIDSRTNLDAGAGYDSYLWNTGATTSSLQGVGVGEYSVVLGKNGCILTQVVHVRKAEDPVIKQIEISNTTATVIVNGGKTPYQYALDGTVNWQDSNIFTGLSRGQHTFYVKDAYNCNPVAVEVTVPNLINAITPNGDNRNDYIDYSALSYKENLSFMVYDRYGNKIFTGEKFSNYKWDGTHFNKKIKTGTYWYHINWNESDQNKTPIQYTGWILVKNID